MVLPQFFSSADMHVLYIFYIKDATCLRLLLFADIGSHSHIFKETQSWTWKYKQANSSRKSINYCKSASLDSNCTLKKVQLLSESFICRPSKFDPDVKFVYSTLAMHIAYSKQLNEHNISQCVNDTTKTSESSWNQFYEMNGFCYIFVDGLSKIYWI